MELDAWPVNIKSNGRTTVTTDYQVPILSSLLSYELTL